jgi:hypothetical protein
VFDHQQYKNKETTAIKTDLWGLVAYRGWKIKPVTT